MIFTEEKRIKQSAENILMMFSCFELSYEEQKQVLKQVIQIMKGKNEKRKHKSRTVTDI